MDHMDGKSYYEISILAPEEERVQEVIALLKKHGAEETAPAVEARRITLAYPIKKHTAAYFAVFAFVADPETIGALTHDLNLSGSVLRFLILAATPRPHTPEVPPVPRAEAPAPAERPRRRTGEKPEPRSGEAVTNEELERRLEEILNQ